MRIRVQLPKIESEVSIEPEECPYPDCNGRYFKAHGIQGEAKTVRDFDHEQVTCQRKRCLKCTRTFRVYPPGVSGSQQSDRLKAVSVLLYVLGISYGGVADFLTAWGCPIGKTTVYENVQAAGFQSRQRQKRSCENGKPCAVLGSDGTYIKIKGVKIGVQVVVNDSTQDLLGLELTASENSPEAVKMVREIAQEVGAEVLVSDDLGSYQEIADELGLDHQICRKHVKDNVDALADALFAQLKDGEPVPDGVDASPGILAMDLGLLQWLIRVRPADAPDHLKQLYRRYQAAPKPEAGQKHPVWYRMRMLITRLWERWARLTLDQRRDDMDGTNNASERVIGWWIKERYRTMRGYKRGESVRNVVTLTARMGAKSGHYDMTELYVM
jgi:transposase-like protein